MKLAFSNILLIHLAAKKKYQPNENFYRGEFLD